MGGSVFVQAGGADRLRAYAVPGGVQCVCVCRVTVTVSLFVRQTLTGIDTVTFYSATIFGYAYLVCACAYVIDVIDV